jgi:hypothetical protein
MQKYIQYKSYVSVRVKIKFLKDDKEVDEYFIHHDHDRKYLAQSPEDLTKIMMQQILIIRESIAGFIRSGSGYVFGGIKSVKLELTPFKLGFRKARGYIPLYPWLRNRRGIVNIQNKDNKCFWKCLYRAFNPDPCRHDQRDIPARKVQKFMEENNFDEKVFEHGYTLEKLATFEEKYKIYINIYDIGKKMVLRKRNNTIVRFITVIRTLRRR